MRGRALCTAFLSLCLLGAAPPRAVAQVPAETAAARELFVEGSTLAEQGRWEQARDKFERSLRLKRASLTLYSLGVAERQTGKLVEARESFLAFLGEAPTPATKPFERPAREAVLELDKRIARLRVEVTPADIPGLRVELDGLPLHPAMIDQARPINPGAHTITASAPGYQPAITRMNAAEGEDAVAKLSIAPGLKPTPSALIGLERVVPIVLIGSGLATFAAGATTGLVGILESGDAPTSDGPEAKSARSKALVGDIVGGAGLAITTVGIVMLIVQAASPSKAAPSARAAPRPVEPWGSGSAAGVRVRF